LALAAAALGLCLTVGRSQADPVYFYRDAEGVIHFRNAPGPGFSTFAPPEPLGSLDDDGAIPRRYPDSGRYDAEISEYAAVFGVERALVKAVIRAESGFNRLAVSNKGARGLMQLMPATARLHEVANVWNPRDNIRGGVRHLRFLIERYRGNLPWALAAYNAGMDRVTQYRGIPPFEETRTYVARVLRFRRQYLRDERLAVR